jgi:hypothetical protein
LLLLRRLLLGGEAKLAQVVFRSEVLDAYRSRDGVAIYRTNSAGKLQQRGGWYVDFGITDGDTRIHTSLQNLEALPEQERLHWLDYAVTPPLNEKFLRMQLGAGACTDDGDVRAW